MRLCCVPRGVPTSSAWLSRPSLMARMFCPAVCALLIFVLCDFVATLYRFLVGFLFFVVFVVLGVLSGIWLGGWVLAFSFTGPMLSIAGGGHCDGVARFDCGGWGARSGRGALFLFLLLFALIVFCCSFFDVLLL